MCNSGSCEYENSLGDCRKPRGHLCPLGHSPDECDKSMDDTEHYREQRDEMRAEMRRGE